MEPFNSAQADIVRQKLASFGRLNINRPNVEYLLEELEGIYKAIRPLNVITEEQIKAYESNKRGVVNQGKARKKANYEVQEKGAELLRLAQQIPAKGPISESLSKELKQAENSPVTDEKLAQLNVDMSLSVPLINDMLTGYNFICSAKKRKGSLRRMRRGFRYFKVAAHIFTLAAVSVFTYLFESFLGPHLGERLDIVKICGTVVLVTVFLEKGIEHLVILSTVKKIKGEYLQLKEHFELIRAHEMLLRAQRSTVQ